MNINAARIAELRKLMKDRGIDAYIIPSADYHQSEYVSAHFKAREYMTGFNGSLGTAVITQNDGGLWTDGRYFTQAKNQLEGSGVRLMKLHVEGTPELTDWIISNVPAGGTVGFDGRTVSVQDGREYMEVFGAKGIGVQSSMDLVGEIWTDRPPLSEKPCFYLEEKWTGESTAHKLSRVRAKMDECGADVHIIAAIDDVCWLLNFRGDDIDFFPLVLCYAAVYKDHVDLYIDERKLNDGIRSHFAEDGVVLKPYNDIYEDVKKIPENMTALIDPARFNHELACSLKCRKVEDHNPTVLMKAMKNPVEIRNIKNAELKDSVALTKFIFWIKNNYDKMEITELSASAKLTSLRREQEGYIRDSFAPLQAFGEHAAMMHYSPTPETDVVLKEGEMLLSDTGGGYYEGSTDITRTTVLGHIEPRLKKYYTAVFRANQHLSAAKFLYGNHGWSLDVLCRQPIWDLGLDYQCGTGHGFGYLGCIHEPPTGFRWYVVPERDEHHQFEEGMCVTIEPGIYEEGDFGIRIENNVVTVKDEKNKYGQFMRFEMMTFVPIDLDAIDPEELTKSEREWLNDYHRQCYEKLSPYMTDEENEWLREYTRAV